MIITSIENKKIKEISKLKQKKYRDISNTFLVEGEHLVEEAAEADRLEEVIILDGYDYPTECKKTYVSLDVMNKLTNLDTPTNIIGLCRKDSKNKLIGKKFLILDEVQDPGNLGTIIRSAVAFNIDTIILSENTVDLYNPKVIRATQGMLFHTNIVCGKAMELINSIKEQGITVYGTDVVSGVNVKSLSREDKASFALVMGNEGNGVRLEIKELCDKNLYIKTNENVESLNVAIATSILLYELGDYND